MAYTEQYEVDFAVSITPKIKQLQSKKDELEPRILTYIHENNLENQIFELPNYEYKVKQYTYKSVDGLTYKYIHKTLSEYFQSKGLLQFEEESSECISLLKNNRGCVEKKVLKKK